MTFKIAASSYCFSRLGVGPEGRKKPNLEELIEKYAELGIDGVELLGVHFESTDPEQLAKLRQTAVRNGIDIVAISAHHNFVNPDPQERLKHLNVLSRWVDVAHELGAGAVRAFGGRWGTSKGFVEFMNNSGVEEPLEGYTDDDAFAWSAEAFRTASYYAGRKGVTLALENHWGLTGTAEGTLRILNDTASPWMKIVLDTGNFNFRPDQYAEMAQLIPHAIMVHAKTYVGGGLYYTADLDYKRIGKLLKDGGYKGYVSIEAEGKAPAEEGLRESVAMLKEAFADL